MPGFRFIVFTVFAAAAVLAGEASDVLELDDDNFVVGVDKDIVLVEFYAPW